MSRRRLLVVTTVGVDESLLRDQVLRRAGAGDAEVKVVAPAAKVSPLQWLASDEDAAREEATTIAEDSAQAVADEARVETEIGDPDPLQAIEDALRTFPADELIVVTQQGEQAGWLEKETDAETLQRFGLPVTHLTADEG